jgi:hypothetical protein
MNQIASVKSFHVIWSGRETQVPLSAQVDGLEIIPFCMSVDDPTFQIMVLSRLIPHMNNFSFELASRMNILQNT